MKKPSGPGGPRYELKAKSPELLPAPSRGSAHVPTEKEIMALAERIAKARERRKDYFSHELFSEPGWDMLLHLFQAEAAGLETTVSNLAYLSGAPTTTALRWIDKLVETGAVKRRKSTEDARTVLLELGSDTKHAVHDYLCQIWTMIYGPSPPTVETR